MIVESVYAPLKVAVPFHNSKAMVRCLLAGRTGGKTYAGVNEGFKVSIEGNDKTLVPNRGIFTCQSDELIEQNLIPVIEETLPRKFVRKFNSKGIWFINDSVIKFRTGYNPEGFRGAHCNWMFMDEAREFPNVKAFQNFVLGAKNGFQVWMSSTPKGKNWIYWNIIKKWRDGNPDYDVFLWDSYQNKFRNEETLAKVKEALNGDEKLIQQELYAQIVSMEGLVWPVEEEELNVDMPGSFYDIICGVDFGHDHPTVFETIARTDNYWVGIDEVVFRQKPTSYTIAQAVKIDDKFGNQVKFYCDPSRPDIIQDMRHTKGTDGRLLRAYPAENDVDAGISKVGTWMDDRRLRLARGQLKLFRDQYTGYAYGDNDKPIKEEDDTCDAMRYAVMAAHGVSDIKIIIVTTNDIMVDLHPRNRGDILLPTNSMQW